MCRRERSRETSLSAHAPEMDYRVSSMLTAQPAWVFNARRPASVQATFIRWLAAEADKPAIDEATGNSNRTLQRVGRL